MCVCVCVCGGGGGCGKGWCFLSEAKHTDASISTPSCLPAWAASLGHNVAAAHTPAAAVSVTSPRR